ncbi:MAG TPA: hypothetical protein VN420_05705 [Candidatus Fimivivens sp.]|nr:hypothetical protein [Candidatus Fimivivens sp.]
MNIKAISHNAAFLAWKGVRLFSCREELNLLRGEKLISGVRESCAKLDARSRMLKKFCQSEYPGITLNFSERLKEVATEYAGFSEGVHDSIKNISLTIAARTVYQKTVEMARETKEGIIAYASRFEELEDDMFRVIKKNGDGSSELSFRDRYEAELQREEDCFYGSDVMNLHNPTLDHIKALERNVSVRSLFGLSDKDAHIRPVTAAWSEFSLLNHEKTNIECHVALMRVRDILDQSFVSLLGHDPIAGLVR